MKFLGECSSSSERPSGNPLVDVGDLGDFGDVGD